MLLTAHQPNYLPYLGFFEKLVRADTFLIVDNVQYVKRGPFGWIHRNRVLTGNGPTWLSVPVFTKGKYTQDICEVEIDNRNNWRKKHWRTMDLNYRKAPYFSEIAEWLAPIYEEEWVRLVDLSEKVILSVNAYLGIDIPADRSSNLGITGKDGTDLVVELCKGVGADQYLSGMHGKDYLDIPYVASNGITLIFQDYEHPEYSQIHSDEFVPYMSVVDLLFNHGPESRGILAREA